MRKLCFKIKCVIVSKIFLVNNVVEEDHIIADSEKLIFFFRKAKESAALLIQLTIISDVVDDEFILEIFLYVLDFEEKPMIVFRVVNV